MESLECIISGTAHFKMCLVVAFSQLYSFFGGGGGASVKIPRLSRLGKYVGRTNSHFNRKLWKN